MKAITLTSNILRRNKLLIFFSAIAVIVCFALLQIKPAFAQDATGSADPVKKYQITFPISTLGNCADLQSCKTYCEDPVNKEACVNFAKSKGFYKPNQGQGNARARLIIEKAKTELGCNTEAECKTFCANVENIQKCAEFAKKYSIENGKKKIINNAILEKAKTALGCTSEESCKALCRLEENREKCSQFARSAGLPGGMVKVASGSAGFDKVRQIIEKCQLNQAECEANLPQIENQLMRQSDEFCKINPNKCKEFLKGLKEASRGGKFTPNSEKAYENANANARFCRENPEKCKNASGSAVFDVNKRMEKLPKPDKIQFKDQFEIRDPQVQGVSKAPSFFDWFFNVFLK